jgi:hypothetical protein
VRLLIWKPVACLKSVTFLGSCSCQFLWCDPHDRCSGYTSIIRVSWIRSQYFVTSVTSGIIVMPSWFVGRHFAYHNLLCQVNVRRTLRNKRLYSLHSFDWGNIFKSLTSFCAPMKTRIIHTTWYCTFSTLQTQMGTAHVKRLGIFFWFCKPNYRQHDTCGKGSLRVQVLVHWFSWNVDTHPLRVPHESYLHLSKNTRAKYMVRVFPELFYGTNKSSHSAL